MIRGTLFCLLSLICLAGTARAAAPVQVVLATSMGDIEVTLDAERAPGTVANFLQYVDEGFYDGTIFHRVIDGFMIQGGGLLPNMRRKPARDPVRNESDNGLVNARGTIAMARTRDPHSATAQFFINLVDNAFLDRANAQDGWGYTVFGRVTGGMAVVDSIGAAPTSASGRRQNVPRTPIVLEKVTRKAHQDAPTGENQ